MNENTINIVWLKRDLRIHDHAPFASVEALSEAYRIIYIFESSLLTYPDTSLRHLQFIYHSIVEMNRLLKPYSREVELFYGEAIEVFTYLIKNESLKTILSHQESGIQLTWNRDKQVKKLFQQHEIRWIEYQRDGIKRGRENRNKWDKEWFEVMTQPIIQNKYSMNQLSPLNHPFSLPKDFKDKLETYPKTYQPAGERFAWRYLRSFIENRGLQYHKFLSKPTESRTSCARISPYLSWGNLSIRQVYQFVSNHPNAKPFQFAIKTFKSRLIWHCHFIQKFEMECRYETECINKGYESMTYTDNEDFIQAWKTGQTGFPLVDACMRCLQATGWVNFRMRAMLVSFFCHHLDQDWRKGHYHLARLFLDYEPGIHYPQWQMQAGTTGINTVRIYNPLKQSQEHDPKGIFIKKWIPELQKVPTEFIHEPWTMPPMLQQMDGVEIGKDYPKPIIDLKAAYQKGRDKIWGYRKRPEVIAEKQRILNQHVGRNRSKRRRR